MKNKIVTHFYVKGARKDSKGLIPIYLRITINGERAEISTDKKINPESCDKSNERVAGKSEPARIINAFLDTLTGKVGKYFSNLDVISQESLKTTVLIPSIWAKSLVDGSFICIEATTLREYLAFTYPLS